MRQSAGEHFRKNPHIFLSESVPVWKASQHLVVTVTMVGRHAIFVEKWLLISLVLQCNR